MASGKSERMAGRMPEPRPPRKTLQRAGGASGSHRSPRSTKPRRSRGRARWGCRAPGLLGERARESAWRPRAPRRASGRSDPCRHAAPARRRHASRRVARAGRCSGGSAARSWICPASNRRRHLGRGGPEARGRLVVVVGAVLTFAGATVRKKCVSKRRLSATGVTQRANGCSSPRSRVSSRAASAPRNVRSFLLSAARIARISSCGGAPSHASRSAAFLDALRGMQPRRRRARRAGPRLRTIGAPRASPAHRFVAVGVVDLSSWKHHGATEEAVLDVPLDEWAISEPAASVAHDQQRRGVARGHGLSLQGVEGSSIYMRRTRRRSSISFGAIRFCASTSSTSHHASCASLATEGTRSSAARSGPMCPSARPGSSITARTT